MRGRDRKKNRSDDREDDLSELIQAVSRETRSVSDGKAPVRPFRGLVSAILQYPALLWAGVSLVVIVQAITLLGPYLIGYAIDEGIQKQNRELIGWVALAILAIEITRLIGTAAHGYIFAIVGQRVMQDLRLKLFQHLQRLPLAIYDRIPSGKLVTRVTNDIAALTDLFTSGFITGLGNVLMVVGNLAAIWYLHPKLGLIVSSSFPVLFLVSAFLSKKLQLAYRAARARLSALNAFLAENILGMRVIQQFGRERQHLREFDRFNEDYAHAQYRQIDLLAVMRPSISVFIGISMALLLYYGGERVHQGALQIGLLSSLLIYTMRAFEPIQDIMDKWTIFLSGMSSAERIFSILSWDAESGVYESKGQLPAPKRRQIRGEIVFENVWFAYQGEEWVLKDLSFRVEPGQKIGIVGPTGSGKTSLMSLLMRFYDPQKGRILIDGVDIREIEKRELRSSIGLIQQDVFLFSGSMVENLSLFRDELGVRDEIRRMLERRLRENARSLEEPLQERGGNLSMGERQLLAFARAWNQDPTVWVLDEATASIDTELESEMNTLLDRVAKGRTRFLIAHRLSTVRQADQILVLKNGEKLEWGNHRELMQADGLYARLYRFQEVVI